MTTTNPKITMTGRRAIESDLPLFVLGLDGRWRPGTEATRPRALRFLERGLEYATWVYGVAP